VVAGAVADGTLSLFWPDEEAAVQWRRWALVVAAVCGLVVAGRLLDLPQDKPAPATASTRPVSDTTLPAPDPAVLRRPLRLPGLRPDGSCPTSRLVGPPITKAHRVAAVAVGDGPVYPVLFEPAPRAAWTRARWPTGTPPSQSTA
jgi:hypothetical protein